MPQLFAGDRLGRYVVVRRIGRGGFSLVCEVREVATGVRRALKCVRIDSGTDRLRALQEGQLHASLQHPNIVHCHDVFESQHGVCLVFDLVDGPTLAEHIDLPPADPDERAWLVSGLIHAVCYLHSNGILHRDVKPGNVLLRRDTRGPTPLLTDFGTAAVLSGPYGLLVTEPGLVVGTPAYMAPERLAGRPTILPGLDVYSLGCVLYQLYCGRLPFRAASLGQYRRLQLAEAFPAPTAVAPDLSGRVAACIIGCLRAEPSRRIPDASTLRAAWHGDLDPGGWAWDWVARPVDPDDLGEPPDAATTAWLESALQTTDIEPA